MQALDGAELRWPMNWRGMGASAKADGSHDVRSLQKLVLTRRLKTREGLLLSSAIAASVIRRDGAGNPALDQGSRAGRIDALSATVIASGLSELEGMKPRRSWRPGRVGMSRNHERLNKKMWAHCRFLAFTRDKFRCVRCGLAGKLEVHHITALSRGGSPFALDNLKTLCRDCHLEHAVFGPRLEWRNYLKTKFQEINQ